MTLARGTIVLIGMRGVGKTSVGRALARRLDLPFVDLDHLIEAATGRAVRTLFEAEGESLAGDRATFGPRARRPLDIGVDLHLALIGVAAEVRVDEVFDFLAGLVGADPQVDDAEGMPISTPFEGGAADE